MRNNSNQDKQFYPKSKFSIIIPPPKKQTTIDTYNYGLVHNVIQGIGFGVGSSIGKNMANNFINAYHNDSIKDNNFKNYEEQYNKCSHFTDKHEICNKIYSKDNYNCEEIFNQYINCLDEIMKSKPVF